MALEPLEQFASLLQKAKNILILLPQNPDGDAIGSAWAFYFFLKKRESAATIAFANGNTNLEKYQFLPQPETILNKLTGARDFILSFNTKHNPILSSRAEKLEDEFRVYITPEHGAIDPRDFSFTPASFRYDLVVTFNCPDKEATGKIYEENPDIFYEIPVVNIDHHSNNENFGQINLVNLTASSTSEVLAEILEKLNAAAFLDENIANCLLTGIISATESFQKRNTTPKALQIAATLMDKGADQQKIIRYLYKTQPLSILKFWGIVMARLKWDEDLKLAWSPVYLEDFVQSRSDYKNIPLVLDKIRENYSAGKMFLIFFNDTPDSVRGVMKFNNPTIGERLVPLLGGALKGGLYEFTLPNKNITEAEKEILEKLRILKIEQGL